MRQIPDNEKLTVLAVDDSAVMLEALKKLLDQDYHLILTKSLADFEAVIKSVTPEIILLDLNLPDGNGIDICRSLRAEKAFSETAILIITATTDSDTIEKGYLAGSDDFIRKPFIPYELKAKILMFEKIIRDRSNIHAAYISQLELNNKLNTFNQIVQENIITRDPESSFKTAEHLSEIINVGYIEVVKKQGPQFITLVKKEYEESGKYRPFEELNKILSISERFAAGSDTMRIKSGDSHIYCLVIPLLLGEKIFGYILFENNTPFRDDDQKMINLFSNFFTILHNRFSVEHAIEKMNSEYKSEVSRVRKIQVSSLPDFSRITGYDISSAFLPAQDISGDFFDGYFISEKVYQIILCDVSGHGIASSFIGNQIRTLFKTLSGNGKTPAEIVKEVNDVIAADLQGLYYFATVLVLHINLESGVIRYVSAGHPPMFYYRIREKSCTRLPNTGPLMGLFPDNLYNNNEVIIEEGDSLILYTDGIPEAGSAHKKEDGEMFGEQRIEEQFIEGQGHSSRDIIHTIIGSLYEFTEYADQEDDITIICIRRDRDVGDIVIF